MCDGYSLFREVLLHTAIVRIYPYGTWPKVILLATSRLASDKRYRVVLNREMEVVSTSEVCGSADFIVQGFTEAWNVLTWEKTVSYVEIKRRSGRMNFKPVVASLFALGLVCSPVWAADEAKEQNKHHQKHHERHHARHHEHHGARAEHRLSGEYSAQERFIDTNAARSPVAAFDWVNRFHLSGMINVDGKYSSRAPLGTASGFRINENASDINVNNANLFVDVDVNRLVSGHIGVAYVSDSVNLLDWDVNTNFNGTAFTDSVRSDKGAVWANGRLSVDEAYITIRDFSQSPIFFRAGKMYVPFGDNSDIYPITYSLSQLLSQTRGTAAQAGWVSNYGLYGSIYALTGAESSFKLARHVRPIIFPNDGSPFESYTVLNNWGANLGYCAGFDDVRYHVSASYIKDIRDSEFLSSIQDLVKFTFFEDGGHRGMGFRFRQDAGVALHGDATYGPVNLTANYVTALHSLLSRHDHDTRQEGDDHHHHRHHDSTHISAGDITGTYNVNFWGYNTGFSLGYQRSWEAAPVLPEWRVQGDIGVCILPHTTLTLEYHYDRDYSRDDLALAHFIHDGDITRQEEGDDHHHHRRHSDERSSSTAALRLGVVF